jgi:acyl carrier protein phosphodiesterase
VDVFYDHLLARDRDAIHPQSLPVFLAPVYGSIIDRLAEIPAAAHPAPKLMAEENWLARYAHVEGIATVLARMSHRARKPNPLTHGEQEFLADPAGFRGAFNEWLKDTHDFVRHLAPLRRHWLDGAFWRQAAEPTAIVSRRGADFARISRLGES